MSGADLTRVVIADPGDNVGFLTAVTTTYFELLASEPDARMMGIADRIADRMPDVVALQEMYMLRKQSPGDLLTPGGGIPATEVVVDFLQGLMNRLADRGAHYAVAAMTTELDVELPMFNPEVEGQLDDARLTDRDIILVRTDLPPGQFRVSNPLGGHFFYHVTVNGLEVLQGWCSVDVFVRGERFRFINTHLQDESVPADPVPSGAGDSGGRSQHEHAGHDGGRFQRRSVRAKRNVLLPQPD